MFDADASSLSSGNDSSNGNKRIRSKDDDNNNDNDVYINPSELFKKSILRTQKLYTSSSFLALDVDFDRKLYSDLKFSSEYKSSWLLSKGESNRYQNKSGSSLKSKSSVPMITSDGEKQQIHQNDHSKSNQEIVKRQKIDHSETGIHKEFEKPLSRALAVRREVTEEVEQHFHPNWKLYRVIAGHLGAVKCVAVDPTNDWFATGGQDHMIKIWDLASGGLKLTLTNHIHGVLGLSISKRHPYLFSAGEDKRVLCWDLTKNAVSRHYHGHLSGVYTCAVHPTLDLLITGGRDSSVRIWDIRTSQQVHMLGGHTSTVWSVLAQGVNPQIISGSADSQVRLWDIVAGKTMKVLTHHKKGVRTLAMNPREFTFASGSSDNTKKWLLPSGTFLSNFEKIENEIVNSIAINDQGVLVRGGNNGMLRFFDYKSSKLFQSEKTIVQPGSLESEAGIHALSFDMTGSRLITCEADKTIKMWMEDNSAM